MDAYIDDTNPSFAAEFSGDFEPAKFIETMKLAGFAMSQDSMMGISAEAIDGGVQVGFITVAIPDGANVHEIYREIRSLDGSVQGHTTIGNEMTIVDFTGRRVEISNVISGKLGLDVRSGEGFAAFISKESYGYGEAESGQPAESSQAGQGDGGTSELAERRWGNTLRSKASAIISDRLSQIESARAND